MARASVYAALWRLLHLLWAAVAAVARGLALVRKTFHRPRFDSSLRSPPHVALLVDEPTPPFRELAQLLLWTHATGATNFTFYDRNGFLKKNEDKLIAAVEGLKTDNRPGEIIWVDKPNKNGYKNGTKHKISVRIMSAEDGRSKILSIVRDACSQGKADSLSTDNITVESVDGILNDNYSFMSEPNLVMYFGELCCTRGFNPWHTRFTEFFSLGSESVNLEDFVELLQRYERCEQRFGK